MRGVIFVFLLFGIFTFGATEISEENNILNSCKYIKCQNVVDLNKEFRIRQCIKTSCNSRVFKALNLREYCISTCMEVTQDLTEEQLEKQQGKLPTILDYSWME